MSISIDNQGTTFLDYFEKKIKENKSSDPHNIKKLIIDLIDFLKELKKKIDIKKLSAQESRLTLELKTKLNNIHLKYLKLYKYLEKISNKYLEKSSNTYTFKPLLNKVSIEKRKILINKILGYQVLFDIYKYYLILLFEFKASVLTKEGSKNIDEISYVDINEAFNKDILVSTTFNEQSIKNNKIDITNLNNIPEYYRSSNIDELLKKIVISASSSSPSPAAARPAATPPAATQPAAGLPATRPAATRPATPPAAPPPAATRPATRPAATPPAATQPAAGLPAARPAATPPAATQPAAGLPATRPAAGLPAAGLPATRPAAGLPAAARPAALSPQFPIPVLEQSTLHAGISLEEAALQPARLPIPIDTEEEEEEPIWSRLHEEITDLPLPKEEKDAFFSVYSAELDAQNAKEYARNANASALKAADAALKAAALGPPAADAAARAADAAARAADAAARAAEAAEARAAEARNPENEEYAAIEAYKAAEYAKAAAEDARKAADAAAEAYKAAEDEVSEVDSTEYVSSSVFSPVSSDTAADAEQPPPPPQRQERVGKAVVVAPNISDTITRFLNKYAEKINIRDNYLEYTLENRTIKYVYYINYNNTFYVIKGYNYYAITYDDILYGKYILYIGLNYTTQIYYAELHIKLFKTKIDILTNNLEYVVGENKCNFILFINDETGEHFIYLNLIKEEVKYLFYKSNFYLIKSNYDGSLTLQKLNWTEDTVLDLASYYIIIKYDNGNVTYEITYKPNPVLKNYKTLDLYIPFTADKINEINRNNNLTDLMTKKFIDDLGSHADDLMRNMGLTTGGKNEPYQALPIILNYYKIINEIRPILSEFNTTSDDSSTPIIAPLSRNPLGFDNESKIIWNRKRKSLVYWQRTFNNICKKLLNNSKITSKEIAIFNSIENRVNAVIIKVDDKKRSEREKKRQELL